MQSPHHVWERSPYRKHIIITKQKWKYYDLRMWWSADVILLVYVPVCACTIACISGNSMDQSNNSSAIIVKLDGSVLEKNHVLRCWGWLSLLNWIGALTLSLLLKLPPRKLEPWFILWNFFLLRLLFISINLLYNHVWNNVIMSGLVLLVATWKS